MSAKNKPALKRARREARALKGAWVRQTERVLAGEWIPFSSASPDESEAAARAEAKRASRRERRLREQAPA